jgi:hypothetical protein
VNVLHVSSVSLSDRLLLMSAKKKAAKKKARKTTAPKPKVAQKTRKSAKKSVRSKSFDSNTNKSRKPPRSSGSPREVESGDLQGLSDRERADSESVDELLEEGNAFEAGVVQGVEEADESEGREVHTREVPEDDVPEEYLDED